LLLGADAQFVCLQFGLGPWPEGFERDVQSELSDGVRNDDLDVRTSCAGAAASVRIESRTPSLLAIDVEDALTTRRSGRDLSLQDVPEAQRTAAVAIAVEELLRAQRVAKQPASPPVRQTEPAAVVRRERLGANAELLAFTGGASLLGGSVGYAIDLHPRLAFEAHLLAHALLPLRASNGRIDGLAIGASVALSTPLVQTRSFEVRTSATAACEALIAWGTGAQGRTLMRPIVVLTAALQAHWRFHANMALNATAGVGGVPLGVTLAAGTRDVGSLSGAVLRAGLGFEAGF